MKYKAIFFDRDDTLIRDKGYMYKTEDLEFFAETFDILRDLQSKKYLLFIVTNQSGIGRGYFNEGDMHVFNNYMLEKLSQEGIQIQEVTFCPHAPEDHCKCRKPMPILINQLCDKYNILKSQSYMLGDKESDIQAAKNAEIQGIYVHNGQLKKALSFLLL